MPLSKRGKEWKGFSDKVAAHIEEYTVPQYGDIGEDRMTDDSAEDCIREIKKYILRFGRNVRPGQEMTDLIKMAHYACIAHSKLDE